MSNDPVSIQDILNTALETLQSNYKNERDSVEMIIDNKSVFIKDLNIDDLKKYIKKYKEELEDRPLLDQDSIMTIQTIEIQLQLAALILELEYKAKIKEKVDETRIQGMQSILDRINSLSSNPK